MVRAKNAVIINPHAGLLSQANKVLLDAGWEVQEFLTPENALVNLDADKEAPEAIIVGFGPYWYDAYGLVEGLARKFPQTKLIGWSIEKMEKFEQDLKDLGVAWAKTSEGIVDAIERAEIPERATGYEAQKTFGAFVFVRAIDGTRAAYVFNELMNLGYEAWALKNGWHMVIGAPDKETLKGLENVDGISETHVVSVDVTPESTAMSVLEARIVKNQPSFGFALLSFEGPKKALAQRLALCEGVTHIYVGDKEAVLRVAGPSSDVIQNMLESSVAGLVEVLKVTYYPGLNIVGME